MAKIIVIGGGASGLVSAIYAAKNNNEVIILEKNNVCGKKILITGNGKCNYWNQDQDLKHYNSSNKELLNNIINEDNQKEILDLFDRIGVVPTIKNGYYYPMSNQAISITNSLLSEIENLNIAIINNANVIDVKKNDYGFVIQTDDYEYNADKVMLATGSKAHPKTGSDGFGYEILKKFNHQLVDPFPALVQLKTNNKIVKEWAGIRNQSNISLFIDDKLVKEETGELLLTDYGVSGICIFNLSYHAISALRENSHVKLEIDFLPTIDMNIEYLENRSNKLKSRTISQILDGFLNYKLVNSLLKKCNIERNSYWEDLSESDKMNLVNNIKKFELEIVDSKGFEEAQICGGGLRLTEINSLTMESNRVDNLYITGELLDISGDCGGYNLTNAFITGMLAGKSAGND